uniref:Uncharacterized protein n=1 Tax=Octactis speculum TaxID=3111310 RepID=A0A7S2DKU3_9STRA|mmetsp:Transcript_50684/g.68969  ORF Transcript_50684/g.68969 Transcript_50684/m.68969 type:complete len:286 (+) Transcript_50684:73-930(+)
MGLITGLVSAGGAAVITVTFIHPIDTVKTRLQVSGSGGARDYAKLGLFGTITTISKEEGVTAFWKGIPAAWMREASYTTLRLGLYKPIKQAIGADKPDSSIFLKFAAGASSGALGSIAGNPFDVLKTKMMAAEGQGAGLVSVAKNVLKGQGVKGFYNGIDANIMRAMMNNATKMASYETAKDAVKSAGCPDGLLLQFSSAMVSGLCITCTVAPFDMVRTRLMNQPTDGPRIYNGFADCLVKLIRQNGPASLWRGFVPMWARVAPTTCLQLMLFEQISMALGSKAV